MWKQKTIYRVIHQSDYEINMPYKTIFKYIPPEEIVDAEIRQSLMEMNTFEIFHSSCDNFCFELQIADDKVKKKTTVKWQRKCKKKQGNLTLSNRILENISKL